MRILVNAVGEVLGLGSAGMVISPRSSLCWTLQYLEAPRSIMSWGVDILYSSFGGRFAIENVLLAKTRVWLHSGRDCKGTPFALMYRSAGATTSHGVMSPQ